MGGIGRPNDGRMHARHTQGEPKGGFDGAVAGQELILKTLQSVPVSLVIDRIWPAVAMPKSVGERSFGNDTHVARGRMRQRKVDCLLVGDIDRGLQHVELAASDSIERGGSITAVAD